MRWAEVQVLEDAPDDHMPGCATLDTYRGDIHNERRAQSSNMELHLRCAHQMPPRAATEIQTAGRHQMQLTGRDPSVKLTGAIIERSCWTVQSEEDSAQDCMKRATLRIENTFARVYRRALPTTCIGPHDTRFIPILGPSRVTSSSTHHVHAKELRKSASASP